MLNRHVATRIEPPSCAFGTPTSCRGHPEARSELQFGHTNPTRERGFFVPRCHPSRFASMLNRHVATRIEPPSCAFGTPTTFRGHPADVLLNLFPSYCKKVHQLREFFAV